MTDTKDRLAAPASAGEIERLKCLFVDAFGVDVLHELPLRLDLLRRRGAVRDRDRERVSPARLALHA